MNCESTNWPMNTSNEDKQKDKLANHPVGKENDHLMV